MHSNVSLVSKINKNIFFCKRGEKILAFYGLTFRHQKCHQFFVRQIFLLHQSYKIYAKFFSLNKPWNVEPTGRKKTTPVKIFVYLFFLKLIFWDLGLVLLEYEFDDSLNFTSQHFLQECRRLIKNNCRGASSTNCLSHSGVIFVVFVVIAFRFRLWSWWPWCPTSHGPRCPRKWLPRLHENVLSCRADLKKKHYTDELAIRRGMGTFILVLDKTCE